jgi:phosphoserine phosphatase RsbU/P
LERDLDVLPCGLVQTLDDGTIRHVNRTFCAWLGTTPEALIGRRFQDLLTMGGKIFHHTHWAPLLRIQGSIAEVKLELVHEDSVIPVVVNAVRRDERGTLVHEIAAYVARDRDRYEQELVRARRRLEDLVNELNELHAAAKDRALFAEQMIGIVGHDLRNPLQAIQMGAEMLAGSALSGEQQRMLTHVERATHRATNLLGDLLDFTRARFGKGITVRLEPLRLHDVAAQSLDELRRTHPGLPLVHVRDGEGACLGDSRRIAQLLGNLVSNAIAYGAKSSPITITTSAGASTRLSVHNLGPPIPDALQATLFEPTPRGERHHGPGGGSVLGGPGALAGSGGAREATGAAAPRSGGGARPARSIGLGLFLVREIARAHGGTASVTSSPQAGTTFRVEW